MLYNNITDFIQNVRSELGKVSGNFSDETITYVANTAFIIQTKILKGYNLTQITVTPVNGVITVPDNKEVFSIRYVDDSGKIVEIDKSDFIQIENQVQASIPNSVQDVKIMCVEPFAVDNMPNDTVALALVYLTCDLLLKQWANPNLGIAAISDGIMNIRYDNGYMSFDGSKYLQLFYKLIYQETSFKMDE